VKLHENRYVQVWIIVKRKAEPIPLNTRIPTANLKLLMFEVNQIDNETAVCKKNTALIVWKWQKKIAKSESKNVFS